MMPGAGPITGASPGTGGGGGSTLNGDVTGPSGSTTVAKLRGQPLGDSVASPSADWVLVYDAIDGGYAARKLADQHIDDDADIAGSKVMPVFPRDVTAKSYQGGDFGLCFGAAQVPVAGGTHTLTGAEQFSFLGTGWTIGLATEAGLKMREAACAWTESYPAMEYRHGPISVTDEHSLTWFFGTPPEGLPEQVAATGALAEASGADAMADLVRVQRLAVALAEAKGLDPDRPRNLTRSIILS